MSDSIKYAEAPFASDLDCTTILRSNSRTPGSLPEEFDLFFTGECFCLLLIDKEARHTAAALWELNDPLVLLRTSGPIGDGYEFLHYMK